VIASGLPGAPPRGRLVLALWVLALLLCALVISRTRFVADMSAFLPASPDPAQQALIEQIQRGAPSRLILLGIQGADAAQRAAASKALAAELRGTGLFEQVQNGEREAWQAAGAWLVDHRYALSPGVTPERFSVAGLRDAFDETLSLLGTPAGAAVKPLLSRDPTGETQRVAEALIPPAAPRMAEGVWVSRQAPRAVLLASLKAEGQDLDGQAHALARVREVFAPWEARGLTLQMSGTPVFAVDSRDRIVSEVRWLVASGAVVMGALLWLAFGTWRALVVAALPVAAGVLAGVAAVGLTFGQVHGMTLGFGSTLIGEAVDYAIYYLIQARPAPGQPADGSGWRRWLHDNWRTVRLGLLTSLCGFAALTFSGFPGLAQLGVFSIAGLVAAAATARWVLPVCMPDGAAAAGWRAPLGRAMARALPLLQRSRWGWAGLAVMAIGALVLSPQPLWRGDLAGLSPVPPAALALDAQLRADLSPAEGGLVVLVRGASAEAALQSAEAVATRLDAWVDEGRLAGYDTPTRLLPSLATQAARRASLPPPDELARRVAEARQGGPLAAVPLGTFLAEVEAARLAAPLTPEALLASPWAPLVKALLLLPAVPGGEASVLVSLYPSGTAPLQEQALTQALAGVPGVRVLQVKQSLDALYESYLVEARHLALAGAAAVALLLALSLRSAQRVLRVALPLAVAVLLCLAGLHLAGVALGVLHWVGLVLVVAVGSNYALFFDAPAQAPGDDPDTLASLALANLTMVLSFGLIALSHIPVLAAIGQVVAPGAALCLLLSAAFAPRRAAAGRV
jgi:predicted exporter